jgi:hypothetical protein
MEGVECAKYLGFSHNQSENVAKADKMGMYYAIRHLKMAANDTCIAQ